MIELSFEKGWNILMKILIIKESVSDRTTGSFFVTYWKDKRPVETNSHITGRTFLSQATQKNPEKIAL